MTPQLQNSVASPQDLKEAILGVRRYARWFAQAALKQRVSGGQPEPQPMVAPAAAQIINQWAGQKPLSSASLDELITDMEAFATSAPRMVITLAAPAPGDLKRQLVDWCRRNVAPDVLVDFRFNSSLLGGLVVSYGSHVYDWSFRRQILAAKDKFPEALRHV